MNISNEAKKMLLEVFASQGGSGIRFYSEGQGCCGPQIGLSLEAPGTNDQVQEINGISVAIEQEVLFATQDLTLDVQENPQGKGFVLVGVNNSCS
ncbi:adhesin [Priestia aryabhattai]|jgi:Fe-S cluster assembly iron-binding protein IscA|uniref:adhesin n=1 Tax=Bacillaceae TaxID=186817 RepID=UPI0009548CCD|nr:MULTISPECIES: adhesin [Bacillaceae]OZT14133.1 adhesin [Priestia aryabhattai]USY56575.1 adhesin [Bacillus sp. 1780r2a1]MBY6087546.1 adhesin [Priestia flexa]MDT2047314.1 adhesin [Priestia flexa]TDB55063.1 adhesin [Bacillus sp. CBEL-1]